MPEEQPLQALVALELVLEAEGVVRVELFEQIEQLGGGLVHGELRGFGCVDEDGDAAVAREGCCQIRVTWVENVVGALTQPSCAGRAGPTDRVSGTSLPSGRWS